VVKEERLHDHLKDIHHVVMPANVCEFVSEQGFQLLWSQTDDNTGGQQDDRSDPADDAWNVGKRQHQHAKLPTNPESIRETHNQRLDRRVRFDTTPA
jgi:hypothetical protein